MDSVIIARNARMLATLVPEMRSLAERHLAMCAAEGIALLVVQALRTPDEQAALYAKGRTAPGRRVTNARPGYSWHNFGRAYDVAVAEGGKVVWTGHKYARAGEIGRSLSLVWGGDFKGIRGDLGHFEYHPGLTLTQARAAAGLL
ncbi:MAG: M15 family metallopeptidase [Nitrospirae bacterium]|nr:M15 family metallopeptidase [Nitrospirota bacterium]